MLPKIGDTGGGFILGIKSVNKKDERLGEEKLNHQGCLMKIVEYNKANDIVVEFQDKYRGRVHTIYANYKVGNITNPYFASILNVGMVGNKYKTSENKKHIKEYAAWCAMLSRCYSKKFKKQRETYEEVTCCQEWLLFENFYEWLHCQENFDKWYNGKKWAIDKDILFKGNKVYSPDTCCLVPDTVNSLFLKSDKRRGDLPIGVSCYDWDGHTYYILSVSRKRYGHPSMYFKTPNDAFGYYKNYKEKIIKQVAQTEYSSGNITKECYEAMINYEVEITD